MPALRQGEAEGGADEAVLNGPTSTDSSVPAAAGQTFRTASSSSRGSGTSTSASGAASA